MIATTLAETLEEFTEYFPGVPEEVLTELIDGHPDYSPDNFSFEGEAGSYAKLAEQMVDDGLYGEIPDHLVNYIDCEAIGRDLDCSGVYEIKHNWVGYYWSIN